MIDLLKIKSHGVGSNLIEFTKFLIGEKGDKKFPDFRKLDLMKVANLVSHTWVFDFRNGIDDGFLFQFSGTKIDNQFGRNVTGHTLEDCYPGKLTDEIFNQCYRQVYLQKRIGFTRRFDPFVKEGDYNYRNRIIETLLFPCSEDDQTINFGIGIANFIGSSEKFEPVFTVL